MNEEQCHNENSYSEYRKELSVVYAKSNDNYEKQISYISAGALGLTFILLEHVFKDIAQTVFKELLVISWIFLSLTLVINLVSHNYVSTLTYKSIQEIDEQTFDHLKGNKRNKAIMCINYLTTSLLVFGVLFFVLFTSLNILNIESAPPIKDSPHVGFPGTGIPAMPPPPPTPLPIKKE